MPTNQGLQPVRDGALTVGHGDGLREPDGSAPARVGQDLRLAREQHGWTLEAVSEHLRIRLSYLQAIEDGRTADLPGSLYGVGYVRAYAKTLGLDPDDIVRRFRAESGEVRRKTELSFPAPVPERGVPALAAVAVGVVLVIGAYVAWYSLSGDRRPGPDAVQRLPERLAPLAAERPATLQPMAAAPVAEEPAETASAEAPPESISPSQAAAAAPPPVAASRIVVRAKSDSFVLVKDTHGQVLLNRLLRGGEIWPVPSRAVTQPGLLLTTRNAGGTELLVDGVPSASLGGDGAVRRDLPLDARAIRDGKLAVNLAPPVFRVSPRNQ